MEPSEEKDILSNESKTGELSQEEVVSEPENDEFSEPEHEGEEIKEDEVPAWKKTFQGRSAENPKPPEKESEPFSDMPKDVNDFASPSEEKDEEEEEEPKKGRRGRKSKKKDKETAEFEARGFVLMLNGGLKVAETSMNYPADLITLDEGEQEVLKEALAPVLEHYGGAFKLNPLVPLLVTCVGIGAGKYMAVSRFKEKENEANR